MSNKDNFCSNGDLCNQGEPCSDCPNIKCAATGKISKYHHEIKPGVWVDVYDVLMAFGVTNPAQQHLAKKALQGGRRGHKDYDQDMDDIITSAKRAKELERNASSS